MGQRLFIPSYSWVFHMASDSGSMVQSSPNGNGSSYPHEIHIFGVWTFLVGGLEHELYDFPWIIIPTDELIFFRGVGQPPTRFSDRGYFGVIVPQSLWASPWPMAKFLFTMAKLPLLDIEVRKMLHIHPKLFIRFYRCYMLLDHWKDPSMNLWVLPTEA